MRDLAASATPEAVQGARYRVALRLPSEEVGGEHLLISASAARSRALRGISAHLRCAVRWAARSPAPGRARSRPALNASPSPDLSPAGMSCRSAHCLFTLSSWFQRTNFLHFDEVRLITFIFTGHALVGFSGSPLPRKLRPGLMPQASSRVPSARAPVPGFMSTVLPNCFLQTMSGMERSSFVVSGYPIILTAFVENALFPPNYLCASVESKLTMDM